MGNYKGDETKNVCSLNQILKIKINVKKKCNPPVKIYIYLCLQKYFFKLILYFDVEDDGDDGSGGLEVRVLAQKKHDKELGSIKLYSFGSL